MHNFLPVIETNVGQFSGSLLSPTHRNKCGTVSDSLSVLNFTCLKTFSVAAEHSAAARPMDPD